MAAKTNPKVTVKSLSLEFIKFREENSILKLCVKSLEQKLVDSEERLKAVEEKLSLAKEPLKTVQSNLCEQSFDSRKNLKKHFVENHPRKLECKKCVATFEKYCDLETHMLAEHETTNLSVTIVRKHLS
jgi:hypothetical protein